MGSCATDECIRLLSLAIFLTLNWFAASSKQMATSFQPFTKSAYREESDALQPNSTLGS